MCLDATMTYAKPLILITPLKICNTTFIYNLTNKKKINKKKIVNLRMNNALHSTEYKHNSTIS